MAIHLKTHLGLLLMIYFIANIRRNSSLPNEHRFQNSEEILLKQEYLKDYLSPNMGVHYKSLTALYPSKNKLNFNIVAQLPNLTSIFTLLQDDRYGRILDQCNTSILFYIIPKNTHDQELLNTICSYHDLLMQQYHMELSRTRHWAAKALSIIQKYMPLVQAELPKLYKLLNITDSDMRPHIRNKRFLPAIAPVVGLLFSAANTALSAYRTFSLKKRLRSMHTDMNRIKTVQRKQGEMILSLSNNLEALAEVTQNGFKNVEQLFLLTDQKINTVIETMNTGFIMLARNIFNLDLRTRILELSSKLQSQTLLLFQASNELRSLVKTDLNSLLETFHILQLGKIPEILVPIPHLESMLIEVNDKIQDQFSGYELLSTNAIDYYSLDSVIWAIQENTLILNIPIYLKETVQEDLQLFRVESFYVPYDISKVNTKVTTNNNGYAYTRIHLDYSYIAIGRQAYILMRENTLADCITFAGYKVCADVLLHAHKSSPSCLSILYYQDSLDQLHEVCEVRYYHHFKAPSLIFEDPNYILLTNVDKDWRIFCENTNFPFPKTGQVYALIEKSTLCKCQIIIGSEHYLGKRIEDCNNTNFKLTFRYPVNSIILYSLKDMIQQVDKQFNYFQAQEEKTKLDIPQFKPIQILNKSNILYDQTDTGVALEKVISMIRSQKENYITAEDMIEDQDDFESWFSFDKVELAITFFMSIFGLISMLITIVLCYRHCKIGQWQSALTAMTMAPTAARASPIGQDQSDSEIALNELRYRGYLILAGILGYVIYKFCHFIYNRFIIYRITVPGIAGYKDNHNCHLYVELTSPQDKLLLYLVSINASMINIEFDRKIQVNIQETKNTCLSTCLILTWMNGYYTLYDDMKCDFPTVIPIPLLKRRKLLRMTKTNCHIRLLIQEDVFYSFRPLISTRDPKKQGKIKTKNLDLKQEETIHPQTEPLLHNP